MSMIIPDEMLVAAGLSGEELLLEIAIMLFQKDRLTLAKASDLVGLDRVSFQRVLVNRQIPVHHGGDDFRQDLENLQRLFPENIRLLASKQSKETLETLAREALMVRLYDLGYLSSGQAARLLGISRWDFLDLLGHYHVSWFDDSADVAEESQIGQ
jgi:predicted HTH domain antitoxin